MKILILMAIRNLWRHARRTLLTVASIAFGLAVILWLQCILAGRNKSMIDRVTSTRTGHLQVHRQDYLKDKAIQFTFTPAENLIERLPPGAAAAPRVYLPSLISSGEQSSSIMLVGIDPVAEQKVTDIANSTKGSSYLENDPSPDCTSRQILIGKSLATFLHADIGAKLVIMTQAADGTLGNDLFRVKGIYESGSPDMDKSVAYAPINCAAKVGALQGIHELAIHLPDPRALDAVRASLTNALPPPPAPPMSVSTWKEAMPSLASIISLNDSVLMMISV
ncbi:MAG: ABC transporter permease, partial [Proteobacteria bacterium]